ncbi:hypothetical protein UlMin_036614 [Ulmus minor]
MSSSTDVERPPVRFVHTISEAGRLLPSSSRWNSIEVDFKLGPQSSTGYDSLPSRYSKSYVYDLVITDRKHFKRFLYISGSVAFLVLALILVVHFVPRKHEHHGHSKNLTLAVNQALTFFDAQKSGPYPKDSPVKFRGDSGLQDGNSSSSDHPNLVGGFYDSGNNMKFSFPTAYTITLLSWTVIEYHQKYADIGELDHVKDIIKWGTDYLLKVFVPPQKDGTTQGSLLYSQVGFSGKDTETPSDTNCWERPEDMDYQRPVSFCDSSVATDLAGEIVAALSAASIVFKEDSVYSVKLVKAAENLYELTRNKDPSEQGTYTELDECGKEARNFYNSSGYLDELVWGGTWLFFATGNASHLEYATKIFSSAQSNETSFDKGIFYWNNKLTANAVLLTRLRFFHDIGYPYEDALSQSALMTDSLMCSYFSDEPFSWTQGGLILQSPENEAPPLQFAATASFLSKLYSDYLSGLRRSGSSCATAGGFSVEMLKTFSTSQVNYILGDNPMRMSYMVAYGQQFPTQVHHRSASIPWDDGKRYSCEDGKRWLLSKDPNPNVLVGAMVGGPDSFDKFVDERDKPTFTEPSISSNAGLVAALIALHDPPSGSGINLGMDLMGLFEKIPLNPTAPLNS